MQTPRSISEQIGARCDAATAIRLLCWSWIVPAVMLVWAGLAATGFRGGGDHGVAMALARTQAVAVLLAIFTPVVGLIWALRTWDHLPGPAQATEADRDGLRNVFVGPIGHLVAAVVAGATLIGAIARHDLSVPLTVVAATAGCYACLIVPRTVLRAPVPSSFHLAMFNTAIIGQVTFGWLHLLHPAGKTNSLLIAEGLALAWAATAAGRAVGSTEATTVLQPEDLAVVALADGSADSAEPAMDLISPVPALQPLPEPAVGR